MDPQLRITVVLSWKRCVYLVFIINLIWFDWRVNSMIFVQPSCYLNRMAFKRVSSGCNGICLVFIAPLLFLCKNSDYFRDSANMIWYSRSFFVFFLYCNVFYLDLLICILYVHKWAHTCCENIYYIKNNCSCCRQKKSNQVFQNH